MVFYSFEWRDGKAFLADIEPDVEFEVIEIGGEPDLQITALRIDEVDMCQSPSSTIRSLSYDIVKAIHEDNDWKAERFEEAGWVYKTRGGTDPDARWRKPK